MTDPRRSVTIDDLLKLKRAEAPSAEFWPEFERELREKQLAAIVEKRPWWCALPGVYVFVVRRRLPLAAAASALAMGLVSFNVAHDWRAGLEPAAADAPMAVVSAPEVARPALVAAAPAPSEASVAVAIAEPGPGAARPATRMTVASSETVPEIPLLDDMPPSGATERFGALSRSLGGELATSNVALPAGARSLLVGTRDFGAARVIPSRTADPLAQMQAPSEHRSRLLAEAYPMMVSEGGVIAPPSERVLSSLSDERLYSSGGRIDLAPERDAIKLSIRF